jgi:hypothetical protein
MKGLAAEHFLQTPFTHAVRSGAQRDHWACRRAAWVFLLVSRAWWGAYKKFGSIT